jgi:hypothetical protein
VGTDKDRARFRPAVSRLFVGKEALAIITPVTFARGHRKSFKLYWRWKPRDDPATAAERNSPADRLHGEGEHDLGRRAGGR